MNIDWKEALGALKDSGDIPVDNTPDPIAEESETYKGQTEPLRVIVERKGRKGKTATIIEGFICPEERLEEIAKILKQKLGTGGSARGGEILIQGDRKEDVKNILKNLGMKVKG
ncbi:MAG: translation initiation factor [Muribaculaceae bacterium]|nr:translation initiation factor [Muribaculaceae bacterium]MDE6009198.1 translation initiation factor [Muribaculaceae bacterium]MDE6793624.1 translation initiation factor [Muribaculaceae bacterium]